MSYRFLIPMVLFGLIFLVTGCVCPNRDGRSAPDGDRLPLSDKQPLATTPPPPDTMGQKYMPGEVIVKLRTGVGAQSLDALSRELGLELIQTMPMADTYLMGITGGDTVERMVKMLNTYKMVDYAEPNFNTETN